MEIKRLYTILVNNYNLLLYLETILGTKELNPVVVHTPTKDYIKFIINGKAVSLFITSLQDDVILIDEKADSISETYINLTNKQTNTIIMKRNESYLKIIRIERFFVEEDKAISYIEEDHKTYSFDRIRQIYNMPNSDFEFAGMHKLLNSFKYIDEDALVADVEADTHDTLIVYDNKYMHLIDEDVYVKINDQVFKYKYEDNYLDFIFSDKAKGLEKVMS